MKWGVRKAYKKTMRSLGGTKLAKRAIINNNNLSYSQKRQALKEHAELADEKAYKKAKRKSERTGGQMTYDVATKTYSVDKPTKSKHRQRLEEKYREKGMSQRDAEIAANRRITTEKALAVVGGLTIAAASAYVINKHVKERTDRVIKQDTKFQRISKGSIEGVDQGLYVSHKKQDAVKYKGLLGNQFRTEGSKAHKVTLNADKDIKIVSRKKAADTFADLYKNDPEFREAFRRSNSNFDSGGLVPKRDKIIRAAGKEMSDKQLRKAGYDAFNIGLVNHDPDGQSIANKFYSKLKEKGYDAVQDINDKKYSGYGAKDPLIVFNKTGKLSVSEVKKMTDNQIASNNNKAMGQLVKTEAVKQGSVWVGALTAGHFGKKTINSIKVDNYKLAHPNTKMSDVEILKMIEGEV